MARLRCSSLNGRGIADFDEFIHKKFPIILRSCLEALYFDPTTLIETAVYSPRLKAIYIEDVISEKYRFLSGSLLFSHGKCYFIAISYPFSSCNGDTSNYFQHIERKALSEFSHEERALISFFCDFSKIHRNRK